MKRVQAVLLTALLAGSFIQPPAALAAQPPVSLKLSINGKAISTPALVINGQTYVPLSALSAFGAVATSSAGRLSLQWPGGAGASPNAAAAGGANKLTALEGCVNETLFNGVWRFKVLSVLSGTVEGLPGYLVNVELRNGTPRSQSVFGSGLSNTSDAYTLVAADGNTGIWRTEHILNDFADHSVLQAGLLTYTFKFWPADSSTPQQTAMVPTKFIMRIDTQYVNKKDVPYSLADPSFRINLQCRK